MIMAEEEETTTQQELAEPLLSLPEEEEEVASSENASSAATSTCPTGDDNGNAPTEFSMKEELIEMANLGLPLAVSFFCRMVRDGKFGIVLHDPCYKAHV